MISHEVLQKYQAVLPDWQVDDIELLCTAAPQLCLPNGKADLITHQVRSEIVDDELPRQIDEYHFLREQLATLLSKTFIQMDACFDQHRVDFSAAMELGSIALSRQLEGIWVGFENGEAQPIERTVGFVIDLIRRAAINKNLYSDAAQQLILKDLSDLESVVIPTLVRLEGQNDRLSFQQALELRRITLGYTARLTFDLIYGNQVENNGYTTARDRYEAAILALQLADDVCDVFHDQFECVANPLLAAIAETEEYLPKYLIADGDLRPARTEIRQAVPRSYELMQRAQSALLGQANSPILNRSSLIL